MDYSSASWAELAAVFLAAFGSINWGLKEFASTNLVVDLLGSANAQLGYAAVAVAGVALLADYADIYDLRDFAQK